MYIHPIYSENLLLPIRKIIQRHLQISTFPPDNSQEIFLFDHQSCQSTSPVISLVLAELKYVSRPATFRHFDDVSFLKAEITTLFAFKCELRNVLISSKRIFSRE